MCLGIRYFMHFDNYIYIYVDICIVLRIATGNKHIHMSDFYFGQTETKDGKIHKMKRERKKKQEKQKSICLKPFGCTKCTVFVTMNL